MPESRPDAISSMDPGIFFLVVGPSGVGKDSLLDGARERLAGDPRYVFATRSITRPEDAGGEAHLALSEEAFAAQEAAGQFLLTWNAHGLRYGLPQALSQEIAVGRHVVANGSRATIAKLAARIPRLGVLNVTADFALREQRITGRGREQGSAVTARLERSVTFDIPEGVKLVTVANDGSLEDGINRFVAVLSPSGQGEVQPAELPKSQRATLGRPDDLHAKIGGAELDQSGYERVLHDIVQGRYADSEVTSFLVAASRHLSDDEVIAVARVRSTFMSRIDWDAPVVVDKHSMGGIPGSRITMIVVPIVAAHGFLVPKTSSRAITSPAGTADAMETLAKVDLTPEEVRQAVKSAGACIAWNGRLNHSRLDDVMNAITRPMGIDSNRWSVASILSKKLSAGSTHVIVDLPWGPQAKLVSVQAAVTLGRLFKTVGDALGLVVLPQVTDGSAPIGRGIGPALEVRDVLCVLDNDLTAPHDLAAKALKFAGSILAWDPRIGNEAAGRDRALQLLQSGAAREKFEQIIDAQGRRSTPILPAEQTYTVISPFSGHIGKIEISQVSAIARAAGAPQDPSAGIALIAQMADEILRGDPLFTIHAGVSTKLDIATSLASENCGFK